MIRGVVCGDVVAAHRVGCELARPFFQRTVEGTFERIVVSDGLPVAASLYQASKMIAAVAHLLNPGGTIWLVAECGDGIGGSFEVVNEAIFELGMKPRLPDEHTIRLVSDLPASDVERSFCERGGLEEVEAEPALIVPRSAATLLLEAGPRP